MRLNRLPTRSNLLSRGINTTDPSCPWCHSTVETGQHILVDCRTSKEVFAHVAAWASDIGFPASPNVIDDFLVHQPHPNRSKAKEVWDSISRALLWSLWCYRNELVFEGKVKTTMELVEVKRTAFMWSKIRSKNLKNVDWDKWMINPML
ncbi:hypothetical protein LXL04_015745 [Taraxacum kok-saghyz]